jgi:hypothetical protein
MSKKNFITLVALEETPQFEFEFEFEMDEAKMTKDMLWHIDIIPRDRHQECFGWVNTSDQPLYGVPARTIRMCRIKSIFHDQSGIVRRHCHNVGKKPRTALLLDAFWKDISFDRWLQTATKKDGSRYIESYALTQGRRVNFPWPLSRVTW